MVYKLNDKINNLWKEYNESVSPIHGIKLIPNYVTRPQKNKLLFIGLNPAFQLPEDKEEADKKLKQFAFKQTIDNNSILKWAQENESSKREGSHNYYAKYFGKITDVANQIESSTNNKQLFEHCDLFLMRETDSELVRGMVEGKDGYLNEFGREQIGILEEYVKDAAPKIIIVPNAMVSKYLISNLVDKLSYNEQKGCYFLKQQTKQIPVVFCGSWQYGRLDTYTQAIIVRHIKNVLKDAN